MSAHVQCIITLASFALVHVASNGARLLIIFQRVNIKVMCMCQVLRNSLTSWTYVKPTFNVIIFHLHMIMWTLFFKMNSAVNYTKFSCSSVTDLCISQIFLIGTVKRLSLISHCSRRSNAYALLTKLNVHFEVFNLM